MQCFFMEHSFLESERILNLNKWFFGKWSILNRPRITRIVDLVVIHVHFSVGIPKDLLCRKEKRMKIQTTPFRASVHVCRKLISRKSPMFSWKYRTEYVLRLVQSEKRTFHANVHSPFSDPYVAYCNYPGQITWCVSAYLRSLSFCMCTRQIWRSRFTLVYIRRVEQGSCKAVTTM
jgi:hypothetical protein